MRSQNLLLVACIAMVWSAAAAAQGTPQGGAQTTHGAQNPSAAPATSANRARVARQTDSVPPASRGVGTTANRPDCSKMRGIEKSECERRDTSRDDLPAGVTTTQQPQPPR